MASDRDTLAELLGFALAQFSQPIDIADFLLATRVRPPAQVITDPAELEKLPMHSIVVDHHGAGWQMTDRDYDGTAIWEYRTTARSSAELLAEGARTTAVHIPTEESTDA